MCQLNFIIKRYSYLQNIEEYKVKYLFNKMINYYKCCSAEICLKNSAKFPILRQLNKCELETINEIINA
ncbi:MAG TPA: hypothetical protein PKD00_11180 [Burkholderiales bacterium]|nr:hypothetical protein [Burkholderiales bacterium]